MIHTLHIETFKDPDSAITVRQFWDWCLIWWVLKIWLLKLNGTRFVVDMDKPVNWVMDQSLHYHLDSLKVSLIMFFLNIVDFPMFFLLLSTWNDLGHLPYTQGSLGIGIWTLYCHSDPQKVVGWGGVYRGPCDFSDSPETIFLFPFLDLTFRVWGLHFELGHSLGLNY